MSFAHTRNERVSKSVWTRGCFIKGTDFSVPSHDEGITRLTVQWRVGRAVRPRVRPAQNGLA